MLNYSKQVEKFAEDTPDRSPMPEMTYNPFPGLRTFLPDEGHLYFGRDGQVSEVLTRLAKNRVVTVLGYSGSGKSSLMQCGLIPTLYGGFMTDQSALWKIVIAKPGDAPIQNLANSIVDVLLNDGRIDAAEVQIRRTIIASMLRSNVNGLAEVSSYLRTNLNENVFLLVDQFEELFKYKNAAEENSENEAIAFVNLILNSISQSQIPFYVALTMRADSISDCSVFPGLTDLINSSNYLIPQMTREHRRLVIEGPVAVAGGTLTPRLVNRILSDIGDTQDQLPILQHGLMRTWDYWVNNHQPDEPMDLRHYNAVGQISQALSLHANEVYDELNTDERTIAENLFKAITEKAEESQGSRRPAKISEIAELSEVTEAEVIAVVDKFRKAGRSFLAPSPHIPLTSDSVVSLSHEGLMRKWNRLAGWIDDEFESSRMYIRLAQAAAMNQIGKTSVWRPPDLQLALNWQKKQNPTNAWAQRYDPTFERAIVFLENSRITYEAELKNQEMLRQRRLRTSRIINIILGLALLVSIGFFLYGLINNIKAQKEKEAADIQKERAIAARAEALRLKEIAEAKTQEVERQGGLLKQSYTELERALVQTRLAKEYALQQAKIAQAAEQVALKSGEEERIAKLEAIAQTAIAKKEYERANGLYFLTVAQTLEAKSVGLDDKELAGLTAMQGYLFHTQYKGARYDPYVFSGLYYALAKLSGFNHNAAKVPGDFKNKMFALAVSQKTDKFYTTGNDGRIMRGSYLDLQVETPFYSNSGYANRVIALSKDERYLVNGSDSSSIEIFDLDFPERKPRKIMGHRASISGIKFLPDNSGFLSVSADRTMRLTNHVSGLSRNVLNLPYDLRSIDISQDGKWVVGASTRGVMVLISLENYSTKELFNDPSNRILSVAFNPERSNLIAFGSEVLADGKTVTKGLVRIFDLTTKKIKELSGHKAGVIDVEFSPDGKLLASAGLDRRLQMWVVDKEEDLPVVMDNNNGNVWNLAFANNSTYLVASCNNGEIRVYPTDTRLLAEKICPNLTRNMTKEEWRIYVGADIDYESTCKSLLFKNN